MAECLFELFGRAGEYQVRLRIAGEEPIVAPFDFDIFTAGRPRDIIARLESGSCEKSEVAEIGTHLWNALRPEPIRERVDRIVEPFSIILSVPDEQEIDRLPWEALHDETRRRYLACDSRRSVTRLIEAEDLTLTTAIPSGPIRMLVVVPRGSKLDTASEMSNLRRIAALVGPGSLVVEFLSEQVTSDDIRAELRKPWDVFHFIGHSRFTRAAGVEIRINDLRASNDEQWLDANQFAEILTNSTLRLAVFNSCESAPSATTILAGLGQQVAAVAGIPAVVVMRYRIDDPSSARFSDTFYRELLNPEHAGRVDVAIQEARHGLYISTRADAVRSFITPVLYLARGHGQILPEARIAALTPHAPAAVPAAAVQGIDLPADLVDRLRRGTCVPVVGAGLHPPALRDGVALPLPTLTNILSQVADDGHYPEPSEVRAAEWADFSNVLFPRIFQHYENERSRETLVMKLNACCGGSIVPAALRRIASWNVPGIIYTHIDGLMEEALRLRLDRRICTVNIASEPLVSTAQAATDIPKLTLFNLRGTLSDAASLVLTDSDHEALLHDRLNRAIPEVVNLFKEKTYRSLLFIGVSPIDPCVRRLARLFLEAGKPKIQGPRYFVVPHVSAGDRAYWADFDVHWIEADPALVVENLHALLGAQA